MNYSTLQGAFTDPFERTNGTELPGQSQELFFTAKFKWSLNFAVTTVNYILTYDLLPIKWVQAYFYLSDIFLTYIALEFFIFCLRYLDEKVPWSSGIRNRLLVQFFGMTPVVWLFCFLTGLTLETIIYSGRMGPSYYTLDLILIGLFIILVQFIYVSVHFIEAALKRKINESSLDQRLKVRYAGSIKLISIADVRAAYIHCNVTYVLDEKFKRYASDSPLKELDEKLPDAFFRANRQFVISREMVTSFKSLPFGKIQLELSNANTSIPSQIFISRTKAAKFRKWIAQNTAT